MKGDYEEDDNGEDAEEYFTEGTFFLVWVGEVYVGAFGDCGFVGEVFTKAHIHKYFAVDSPTRGIEDGGEIATTEFEVGEKYGGA